MHNCMLQQIVRAPAKNFAAAVTSLFTWLGGQYS